MGNEKRLYYYGIILGLLCGVVGNIFVTAAFRLVDAYPSYGPISDVIVTIITFVAFVWVIRRLRKEAESE
ncbi:MAG: hypothetical protein KO254_04445 [Methanoculleus marisnigri]|nr:hypothetical protein [Methanoculleus marisnigri]